MKLSHLEALVKAMRELAERTNVEDPDVEFYTSRNVARVHLDTPAPFMRMEPETFRLSELKEHMVPVTNDLAKRGDFAIPLTLR